MKNDEQGKIYLLSQCNGQWTAEMSKNPFSFVVIYVLFPSRISKEQGSRKTYENTSNFLKFKVVFLDMNMYYVFMHFNHQCSVELGMRCLFIIVRNLGYSSHFNTLLYETYDTLRLDIYQERI